jgi:hypothetical protein
MKKRSILFVGLMLAAAGAQAGGIGAGGAASILGAAANGANANVTVGTKITGKSSIDATAEATGKDSEAMAGGVMSATPKDQKGLNAKITVGVIDNSTINARAKAQNGGSAYAGGVISK